MAKHAHRLMLLNKKTWRCTLEGCAFFVHIGLAHVLPGKSAVCWDCNEVFTIDSNTLDEEMARCVHCRLGLNQLTEDGLTLDQVIERQLVLGKAGVKHEDDLPEGKRDRMRALGLLPITQVTEEEDIIESETVHTSECALYQGSTCDCGAE